MDLGKENIKKIKELILFTILVLVALWNYKLLFTAVKFLGKVILPFAIGGAIAFILNVPMNFEICELVGECCCVGSKFPVMCNNK